MEKPELLAPAGNLEKLKTAIIYGADAVYIGGYQFGLRAFADNFNFNEMKEGISFAHKHNSKVYLTVNIFAHNEDLNNLSNYLEEVNKTEIDGLIISDPGIFKYAKKHITNKEIHISTQANVTNWSSANFWYEQGANRIILARELALEEVKEIREKTNKNLSLEVFIHGAMCISYSGRCLLSNYMTYRDSNKGECAHPCRWKYNLVEEKRLNNYYPLFEDDRGTYILNSKDLCMIHKIPDLIKTGINGFKIEGRMKSLHYIASIVKSYRTVIDKYYEDPHNYTFDEKLYDEVSKTSHREFSTGFYYANNSNNNQIFHNSSYIRNYDFIGIVRSYDEKNKIALVEQRNRFYKNDKVEILRSNAENIVIKIDKISDENDDEIEVVPHPQQLVKIKVDEKLQPYDIFRKEKNNLV